MSQTAEPKRYLFYISQNYSFEILRPLQQIIRARGDKCAWFVEGLKVNMANFDPAEIRLKSITDVINYNPHAVFVPGNIVPNFIPGLKVQVFHGLEWKKQGHFRIRGFFDLYCTHGEITTSRFKQLAEQYGYFHVVETGWSKLDPLFTINPYELKTDLPVVLFAPTFSPNLTCAIELFSEIKREISTGKNFWIVKFHPKMKSEWIALYQQITADNFQIASVNSVLPLLKRADVLLSDTSSIIGEFLLLGKPAVTYKNSAPGDYLINFRDAELLPQYLSEALSNSDQLIEKITLANQQLHPFCDGLSSERILQATDELIDHPKVLRNKKPLNFLRSIKLRKRLNYWKF